MVDSVKDFYIDSAYKLNSLEYNICQVKNFNRRIYVIQELQKLDS
jgi:hypothetical protein